MATKARMKLDVFAKDKGFSLDTLRTFGVRSGLDGIEVPYYDRDGIEYKRYRIRNGAAWYWSGGKAPIIPYGLHRPVPYDKHVVIVEGESDCWALWSHGVPALGIPGATATGCLNAEQLNGVAEVIVVREPDEAGGRFPLRVTRRLRETGFTGAISVTSFEPYKDAREALQGLGAGFNAALAQVWERREPVVETEAKATAQPLLSSAQFLKHQDRVAWLIDGLLPRPGSALLGADKKTGKSTFFLNLALSIARGIPFLERKTAQGSVLYLSLDEPAAITKERALAMGLADEDPIDFFTERRPLTDWTALVREFCNAKRYALIVIDTFVKLCGIDEIKDYAQWLRAFKPLDAIAQEFNLSYVGSAHTKKDARGIDAANVIAGSTAAGAGVDSILIEQKLVGGARTIETVQRFGLDLEPTVLRMNPDTFELTLGDASYIARRKRDEQRILFLLADGNARNTRDIIASTAMRREHALLALNSLLADALVTKLDDGRYTMAPTLLSPDAITGNKPRKRSEPKERPEPPEPAEPGEPERHIKEGPCQFFIGNAGDPTCQRCGVPWDEHR